MDKGCRNLLKGLTEKAPCDNHYFLTYFFSMILIFKLYILLVQAFVYFLMGDMEQQHKKALEYYRNSLDLYKVGNSSLLSFFYTAIAIIFCCECGMLLTSSNFLESLAGLCQLSCCCKAWYSLLPIQAWSARQSSTSF